MFAALNASAVDVDDRPNDGDQPRERGKGEMNVCVKLK